MQRERRPPQVARGQHPRRRASRHASLYGLDTRHRARWIQDRPGGAGDGWRERHARRSARAVGARPVRCPGSHRAQLQPCDVRRGPGARDSDRPSACHRMVGRHWEAPNPRRTVVAASGPRLWDHHNDTPPRSAPRSTRSRPTGTPAVTGGGPTGGATPRAPRRAGQRLRDAAGERTQRGGMDARDRADVPEVVAPTVGPPARARGRRGRHWDHRWTRSSMPP